MVTNHHALRSRDNIYEYRDSPSSKTLASKAHTDTTSLRSPSSLAMTQKSSSQASLKSGISLKETNGHLVVKSSDRAATPRAQPNGNGHGSPAKLAAPVEEKRLLQPLSSTPVPQLQSEPAKRVPAAAAASVSGSSRSTTPVPSARSTTTHTTTATLSSQPAAQPRRTHLVEGVPQTSV
ncbi:hypothetical protein M5D96_004531 [Drosophila gunungcola]|uniref:Uncharacterized protein n=4 Tax=Drosophila gunungcola TaxID=103775 RepID=A0A9Q0BTG5_9MUSC|nr:hypothetical protein M5D96_004531 [Drosophila gunungcola]